MEEIELLEKQRQAQLEEERKRAEMEKAEEHPGNSMKAKIIWSSLLKRDCDDRLDRGGEEVDIDFA